MRCGVEDDAPSSTLWLETAYVWPGRFTATPLEMSSPRTSLSEMPVVILCGGQGTRLREETERVPKPLVDIGGRPINWHIMKRYEHYSARRFIQCLG